MPAFQSPICIHLYYATLVSSLCLCISPVGGVRPVQSSSLFSPLSWVACNISHSEFLGSPRSVSEPPYLPSPYSKTLTTEVSPAEPSTKDSRSQKILRLTTKAMEMKAMAVKTVTLNMDTESDPLLESYSETPTLRMRRRRSRKLSFWLFVCCDNLSISAILSWLLFILFSNIFCVYQFQLLNYCMSKGYRKFLGS